MPLPFKVIQSFIIVGGGTYLASRLFPKDVENVLFDIADHIVLPLIHQIDPLDSRKLSVLIAKHAPLLCPRDLDIDDSVLSTSLCGLPLSNPLGLAAGYDEQGEVVGPLLDLGFGFVEVGTVTPKLQRGSSVPRVFRREEDEAALYSLNSEGSVAMQQELRQFLNRRTDYRAGLVGVNVGKNDDITNSLAADDYAMTISRLGPSVDYVVVNVLPPLKKDGMSCSCNTEALRVVLLRCCQARDEAVAKRKKHKFNMSLLPKNAQQEKTTSQGNSERLTSLPVFIRMAPDLSTADLDCVLDVILSLQRDDIKISADSVSDNSGSSNLIDGIVVDDSSPPAAGTSSSGAPRKETSSMKVAAVFQRTGGKIPIIVAGGISSGQDAFERVVAGASLVQIGSLLTQSGPGSVRRVKRELAHLLRQSGFRRVQDAVGTQAGAFVGICGEKIEQELCQESCDCDAK